MCLPHCLPGISKWKLEAEVWLAARSHTGIWTPPDPPSRACARRLTPGGERHCAIDLESCKQPALARRPALIPGAEGFWLLVRPKEVILVFFSGLPAQCPHGKVTFLSYSSGIAGTPGKTHQSFQELQKTELLSAKPGCFHFLLSG